MSERRLPKLHFWSTVAGLIFVGFLVMLFRRFTMGLGAISNLSNEMPWGLWIGFDLLCGVALAAGGLWLVTWVSPRSNVVTEVEGYRPIPILLAVWAASTTASYAVAALRAKRAALRRAGAHTDVALWGGLVPDHLDELDRLLDAGAVGFKAFLCDSGWADFPATDAATLRAGCTVAAARDVAVVVHAETDEDRGSVHSEVRAVRWAAQVAAAAGARP